MTTNEENPGFYEYESTPQTIRSMLAGLMERIPDPENVYINHPQSDPNVAPIKSLKERFDKFAKAYDEGKYPLQPLMNDTEVSELFDDIVGYVITEGL